MNKQTVIVNASELHVKIGQQIILKEATLTVFEGERVGLVGRNGAGKSTLLKILANALKADSGILAFKRDSQVAFLPQELPLNLEKTVRENVLDGATYVLDMIKRYENMPHDHSEAMDMEHKIAQHGGWTLDRRVDEAMTRLHLPSPHRSCVNLSGGEKRRVALCRTLISQSDLLLLDEPTNHLDTDAIEWLEQFLARYPGTCIMVTHDRYFLDRVVDRILELTDGIIYSHSGNYTSYLTNKAARDEEAEAAENKRQSFLRRELDWVRRGPKARTTKSKSRLDRYYSVESASGPNRELDIELILPAPPKLSAKIVDFKKLSLSLGEKMLFRDLSFSFAADTCIGIVGPNGVGKTSLIKVMLGELKADSGELLIGNQTIFNYVDQHRIHLNDDNTVFHEINNGRDFIQFGAGENTERISTWTYLKRYLFTDERILTQVRHLSGGERSRLMLAKILKNGGNFIILDEPTNDLDLPTLRILEEGLIRFKGCALVVSHDRYFLNRVCTGILAFEGNGFVYYQEGDYDYYLQKKNERQANVNKTPSSITANAKIATTTPSAKAKKLTWKEKKELDEMEVKITALENTISEIENQMNDPKFYIHNGSKVKDVMTELELHRAEVGKLYSRWHELSENSVC